MRKSRRLRYRAECSRHFRRAVSPRPSSRPYGAGTPVRHPTGLYPTSSLSLTKIQTIRGPVLC